MSIHPSGGSGHFGSYNTTYIYVSSATRTLLVADINRLLNLIPDPSADPGTATTHATDFDEIPPATAAKLRAEISALKAAMSNTSNS